ncbi:MAG: hypothetical protein QGH42_02480 [Kiritimatiellia bacterium]|jgi:hypothetical protein|nr:hypothetical protein [Kiritimatiellia bacterium]MDP6811043.1 hypothetical protein [Kiritimatiellia bacterium]MDP7023102.1 hypothetical protein [Kiritimatiellia bacterium]
MSARNVQGPKVVLIGAGSLFFGRQAIWETGDRYERHAPSGGGRTGGTARALTAGAGFARVECACGG